MPIAPTLAAPSKQGLTAPGDPGSRGGWFSPAHFLVFLLLWAAAQYLFVLIYSPEVLAGGQVDPDGYMRLLRVRQLLDGSATWYDATIDRSNWPFGEVTHWTRPLDALLLAMAAVLRLAGAADPVTVAGALVSPLCHITLCVAMVWVVQPLVPGPERFLAMPAALAQPSLMAYGGAGRADHHLLIFLLVTLALGAWIRVVLDPRQLRHAAAAGLLTAAGLWVGPEVLLFAALLYGSGVVGWIRAGVTWSGANLRLALGMAAGVAIALVLERPATEWLEPDLDRISVVHLWVMLLAVTFWLAARRLERAAWNWRFRLAVAATGAAGAAAAVLFPLPDFFRGAWSEVDAAVMAVWLAQVQELQPLLPDRPEEVERFLAVGGSAILAVPLLLFRVPSGPPTRRKGVLLLLLLLGLVYVPLAAAQMRFATYGGVLGSIVALLLVRRLLEATGHRVRSTPAAALVRVSVILCVLLWPIAAGKLWAAALPESTGGVPQVAASSCDLTRAATALGDPQGHGSSGLTIAAFLDFGPELLYRTPHHVLAGPYHRNRDGIMATHALLTSTDDPVATSIVRERGIDAILLCPPADSQFFGRRGSRSLYRRLVAGELPAWVAPPERIEGAPGFLLFPIRP